MLTVLPGDSCVLLLKLDKLEESINMNVECQVAGRLSLQACLSMRLASPSFTSFVSKGSFRPLLDSCSQLYAGVSICIIGGKAIGDDSCIMHHATVGLISIGKIILVPMPNWGLTHDLKYTVLKMIIFPFIQQEYISYWF